MKSMTGTVTYEGEQTVDLEEDTFVVCFTAVADCAYQPARVSGPPEDCYPEDGELDMTSLTIGLILNSNGEKVNLDSITDACREGLDQDAIEDQIWQQFHERE